MPAEREWPPGKVRPQRVTKPPRPDQKLNTNTNTANDNRSGRHQPFDALAANGRRFGAKRKMPPLGPCGCIRDPDYDRHVCGGEISDHMAEAAAAAIVLLDQLGTPGLLDRRTCAAVWRIGHRRLAEAVHRRTTGAA
jgi:hypothetical protein